MYNFSIPAYKTLDNYNYLVNILLSRLSDANTCTGNGRVTLLTAVKCCALLLIFTSLSIFKNAECLPIARCSEYSDELLVSFSSCMLMELLEQTVKKSENCS